MHTGVDFRARHCMFQSCGSLPKLAAIVGCGANLKVWMQACTIRDSYYAALSLYGPGNCVATLDGVRVLCACVVLCNWLCACMRVCFDSYYAALVTSNSDCAHKMNEE